MDLLSLHLLTLPTIMAADYMKWNIKPDSPLLSNQRVICSAANCILMNYNVVPQTSNWSYKKRSNQRFPWSNPELYNVQGFFGNINKLLKLYTIFHQQKVSFNVKCWIYNKKCISQSLMLSITPNTNIVLHCF